MITLILYSITHLLEAWLEEVVIDMKNGTSINYNHLNHEEHFRSAVLAISWFACGVLVLVHMQQYWLIPAMVVNRRIFFDYRLAQLRDRPRHTYEGDDKWMRFFIWVFGKNGRVKELICELIIMVGSVVMHIKSSALLL